MSSQCFGWSWDRFLWQVVPIIAFLFVSLDGRLQAAVTTVGNVTPVPPVGGGAVAGPFIVGNTSFGSVSVTGGTAITNTSQAFVGDAASGIGTVSLNGFGSNWTLTTAGADLTVGDAGIGTLTVSNSAILTVADDVFVGVAATGMGRVTVTGLGTIWTNNDDMTIGLSGLGIVEIQSGAQLTSDAANIGSSATGQGYVTVSGEFSRWRPGAVSVGSVGFGSVSVLEGGRIVSGSTVTLASATTSRAELVVDGIGSRWSITGSMNTSLGDAEVRIARGGVVATSTPSTISTTGRITMAGGRWDYSAADTNAISLFGLLQGTGTLDVPGVSIGLSGGTRGRMHTGPGDHLLLTGLLTNTGVVDLDGGELEIRGTATNNFRIDARNGAVLRVGSTGLTNSGNAMLAITGGTVDVFGAVNNVTNAQIAVVGGATGVFHDVVTNNGSIFVSPGSQIVMLQNLGFSASAALNIGLSEAAPDDPMTGFGQAVARGPAALAGTLNVSLVSGFMPSLGDTFQIVSAGGGLSGMFANENLPTLATGLDWDLIYGSTSLTLTVVSSANLPGDYNNDGIVDAADYTVWRDTLGQSVALPNETVTIGMVTPEDYTVWRTNFGSTTASLNNEPSPVPEPSSCVLLFAAVFAAARGFQKSNGHQGN